MRCLCNMGYKRVPSLSYHKVRALSHQHHKSCDQCPRYCTGELQESKVYAYQSGNYPDARGHKQVPLLQNKRQFSWEHDSAETIARKINAASGQLGIKTDLMGDVYFFYNACVDGSDLVDQHYTENQIRDFDPGQMVLKMNGGLLFATNTPNGFVWITQMKKSGSLKIPAEQAFQKHSTLKNFLSVVPEHTPKSHEELSKIAWKEIHYDIDTNLGVAYLHFDISATEQ